MKSTQTGFIWALAASFLVALGFLVVRLLVHEPPPRPADASAKSAPRPESDQIDAPEDEPLAEETAGPRYVLVGTVVASDRRWSRASIAVAHNKTAMYRMGEQLPGGARLISIGSDRAVLEQFGTRIVLHIEERSEGARPRVAEPAPVFQAEPHPGHQPDEPEPADEPEADQPPEDRAAGYEQVRPGIYRLDRSAVRDRLVEPGSLFAETRVSLAFDEGGAVQGVRLGLGHSDSVFSRIGLRDGDVLRRVGPLVVDGPDSLGRLADLLDSSRELDVEIERDGQRVRLRYWLDDRW